MGLLAILAGGAAVVLGWSSCSDAEQGARYRGSWETTVRKYVRVEMGLRIAAVRRHEARTGRLPDSWADVDSSGLDIWTWAEWLRRDPGGERHAETNRDVCHLALRVEMEAGMVEYYPWEKARPDHSDGAGLPVVLHHGHPSRHEHSWFRSDDPLPRSVIAFLEDRGGVPPVGTPFAMRSLALHGATEEVRALTRSLWISRGLLLGLPLLLITVCALLRRSRRTGLRALASCIIGVVMAACTLGTVLFGLQTNTRSCYKAGRFTPSTLSSRQRLALLDDAVARGEVEPDVAARARAYIETVGEE